MSSLTLAIPNELRREMKEFRFINWSEVARAAIIDKIGLLKKMDRLLSKSTLTEGDAVRYGRMVKKRQWSKTKKALS